MSKLILFLSYIQMFICSMSFADEGVEHYKDYYELDCRFHAEERHSPVKFCYVTSFYQHTGKGLQDVHLAVGCDDKTFFNRKGRVQSETTLDRLSPLDWAFPAVEVFPQGQLATEGTYTSVLDLTTGRFSGLCYVHKM